MKLAHLIKVIYSLILLLVCTGCPLAMDYVLRLDIVNNADYPIGYYIACGGRYGTFYPDSLPETNDYVVYDIREVYRPGFMARCRDWDKFFENLSYDTLSVFIFHTDTLNKYSWEEVRDGYKILKRYDLGKDDLENMHQLVYP